MSLRTVQNLAPTCLGGYHLIIAIILILKHATFLRLSNMSPESALTHAEVNYREANIDSRIQKFLTESSQEHSDESFATFIMAADLSKTHLHRRDHRFTSFWESVFPFKFIFLPELRTTTRKDKWSIIVLFRNCVRIKPCMCTIGFDVSDCVRPHSS
ncbi:hypothetical protein EDB87DRAFT_575875 [Lactarius vividus]|nr:hypothetical protein EDB87DRAFT_575875 [Lactarius vividus]